eukprot:1191130-Prorocentrum_minimum.AAC.2
MRETKRLDSAHLRVDERHEPRELGAVRGHLGLHILLVRVVPYDHPGQRVHLLAQPHPPASSGSQSQPRDGNMPYAGANRSADIGIYYKTIT